MNNAQTAPKIKKETKNTIKVEFEDRTPFWERVKAKLVNLYTLKKVIYYIFRLVLLLGISYVILFPFFSKISSSFMAKEDFVDVTVVLIPLVHYISLVFRFGLSFIYSAFKSL